MGKLRKYFKYINILLCILLLFGLSNGMFSYAAGKTAVQGITTISVGEGSNNKAGTIFKSDGIGAQGPWYPGYAASSILRIQNNYGSSVKIGNVGMNISLSRQNQDLSFQQQDAKDYMEKMHIKIDYKNPITNLLKGNIFEGTFEEFRNGVDTSISIGRNNSLDLIYTIKMDEEAKVNIAGIAGKVDFTLSLQGEENSTKGDRDDDKELGGVSLLGVSDITGHWAENCILKLIEAGIVVGYPDGTIKPDNTITRAETAVLIRKALELDEKDKFFSGYIDYIPKWARGSIIATTEKGIFEGYPVFGVRLFKANQLITREEMATVLAKGFKITLDKDTSINFTDKNNISDWALEYVKSGMEKEVIVGYPDNTFKPKDNITRAEAFVMICKLLRYNE